MKVKDRVELTVKLVKEYHYDSHFGYITTDMTIYKMEGEDGTVYVWKTSSVLGIDHGEGMGWESVSYGDVIRIKGTVKDFSEYKGSPQIELTRVKTLEVVKKALTREEKAEIKKEEQLASLNGDDFVWTMPYKQYKEHYSDCETIAGSYQTYFTPDGYCLRPATIDVIIREGRLKASGVRGQHFSGYEIHFTEGGKHRSSCYRAVCEENAIRRAMKEFPNGSDFTCENVY